MLPTLPTQGPAARLTRGAPSGRCSCGSNRTSPRVGTGSRAGVAAATAAGGAGHRRSAGPAAGPPLGAGPSGCRGPRSQTYTHVRRRLQQGPHAPGRHACCVLRAVAGGALPVWYTGGRRYTHAWMHGVLNAHRVLGMRRCVGTECDSISHVAWLPGLADSWWGCHAWSARAESSPWVREGLHSGYGRSGGGRAIATDGACNRHRRPQRSHRRTAHQHD